MSQSGIVLVVSLILLATLSLLAVTTIHINTSQLRVIANMQDDMLLEALTQAALDKAVGQTELFQAASCDPPPERSSPDWGLESFVVDYELDVDEPRCLDVRAEAGSSELSPVTQEETLWEVRVTGRDRRTGAEVVLRQGIILHLSQGQCPLTQAGRPC